MCRYNGAMARRSRNQAAPEAAAEATEAQTGDSTPAPKTRRPRQTQKSGTRRGSGAGRLIEAAGLKGRTVGGAMVSPKHANFIVNANGATAKDVRSLMALVQREVAAKFKVKLVPEVELVGEW